MVSFRATCVDGVSAAISPFSGRGSDLQSRDSDVLMSNRYNVMRSHRCQRHFLCHTLCMNQGSCLEFAKPWYVIWCGGVVLSVDLIRLAELVRRGDTSDFTHNMCKTPG